MKIIGIDPGYAIVGWGVVSYNRTKFTTLDYGAITTHASMPFEQRLLAVYTDQGKIKPNVLHVRGNHVL